MTQPSPLLKVLKQSVEWSRDAFILAGICMVSAYPFLHYSAHYLPHRQMLEFSNAQTIRFFILFNMLMIFGAALIMSMVGFFYSKRMGLPGFGETRDFSSDILPFLALGIILIPISYIAADRALLARLPVYFPSDFTKALGQPFIVVSQEVIARFGMVTIVVYFWRLLKRPGHPWPAPLLVAVFAAIQAWLSLRDLGITPRFDLFTARIVVSAFAANLVFGEVYIRRGLVAAVFVHLGLEGKYLLYSFM